MFNLFTVESVQWLARVSKIVEIFYEYIKRVIPSQSQYIDSSFEMFYITHIIEYIQFSIVGK